MDGPGLDPYFRKFHSLGTVPSPLMVGDGPEATREGETGQGGGFEKQLPTAWEGQLKGSVTLSQEEGTESQGAPLP